MTSTRIKVQGAAALSGMLAVSALVFGASQAAFSGSTSNESNNWAAGTVTLTDNDSDNALFEVTDMVPGDQDNNCIEVTYTGNSFDVLPIRFYATVTGTGLEDDLDVVINAVDDCTLKTNPAGVYTGALDGLPADYANGVAGFTPASGDTMRGYDITVTLGTDTANTEQSKTAAADFAWEIRSDDATP